ncbi:hypothetical protein B0H19DRAFT_1064438 [Mycena capillaripes]|nr:hypothetical protein B0H19DRAFT_1064438 [Mycena capillaripes]
MMNEYISWYTKQDHSPSSDTWMRRERICGVGEVVIARLRTVGRGRTATSPGIRTERERKKNGGWALALKSHKGNKRHSAPPFSNEMPPRQPLFLERCFPPPYAYVLQTMPQDALLFLAAFRPREKTAIYLWVAPECKAPSDIRVVGGERRGPIECHVPDGTAQFISTTTEIHQMHRPLSLEQKRDASEALMRDLAMHRVRAFFFGMRRQAAHYIRTLTENSERNYSGAFNSYEVWPRTKMNGIQRAPKEGVRLAQRSECVHGSGPGMVEISLQGDKCRPGDVSAAVLVAPVHDKYITYVITALTILTPREVQAKSTKNGKYLPASANPPLAMPPQ